MSKPRNKRPFRSQSDAAFAAFGGFGFFAAAAGRKRLEWMDGNISLCSLSSLPSFMSFIAGRKRKRKENGGALSHPCSSSRGSFPYPQEDVFFSVQVDESVNFFPDGAAMHQDVERSTATIAYFWLAFGTTGGLPQIESGEIVMSHPVTD